MSEITTITFITHPIPDAARLFISFTGNVPIENIEDVKVAAAIALGV